MNKADIDYIIEKLDSYKPDNIYDGYNSVKEKQDQRVSEVLDSLKVEFESDYENGHTPMPKEVVNIPAVQPEQKIGRWIEQTDTQNDVYYVCSNCKEAFTLIEGTPTDNLYNYCPNCGAKMESEA